MLTTNLLTNDKIILENKEDFFIKPSSCTVVNFTVMCHTPDTIFSVLLDGVTHHSFLIGSREYFFTQVFLDPGIKKVSVYFGDSDAKVEANVVYDFSNLINTIRGLFL